METVRTFIAAQIGDKLRGALGGVIDELKKSDPYVKWVKPENLHVTLKFLGEVGLDKIDAITMEMQNIAAADKHFSLSVSGIGVLPNPRYPRVVYSNLVDDEQKLKNLSQRLDEAMARLGFKPEERDFLPHLTIGRVKSFKAKSLLIMKIREFHKKEIGRLDVGSVHLIKSELKLTGAIYTEMASAALGKKGGTDV